MSKIDNIVVSELEPRTTDLWLSNGSLKYFGSNGWTSVSSDIGLLTLEGGLILNDVKRNKVNDMWALATGESTYAHGYASATFNENTVAYNDAESAFGRFNKSKDGLDLADQTLFSIGIGTGDPNDPLEHGNAFEVMQDGKTYLVGIGNYDGTNAGDIDVSTLQDIILAGGGAAPTPLDTFDASQLYDAYTNGTPITPEFKDALINAVNRNALVYITNDNGEFSFKVIVVFAGKTKDRLDFTASDHVAHYKISVDLGTNIVTLSITNIIKSYVFNVEDTKENNENNLKLATQILLNKLESVRVKGVMAGVEYDTLGIYSNGYITTMQEDYYTVFSVNFNTGKMEILTKANVAKLLPFAELKVGNDEVTMQYNIENLPVGSFFVHMEYGYGVGTFQDGVGGFAHITNAYGNEAFFTIGIDGSIMPDRDYVKPNEPYTLKIEQDLINTKLEDVVSSALKRAGEIVVITSAGPITYTRTTDSNDNVIYFTDTKKNGQTVLLVYNNTTKRLDSMEIDMVKASATTVGGVKQGTAVQDASAEDAIEKLNSLLASLRAAGIIANN